eukprot:6180990-Pleurochrysis_carterae.AAC.2
MIRMCSALAHPRRLSSPERFCFVLWRRVSERGDCLAARTASGPCGPDDNPQWLRRMYFLNEGL